MHKGMLENLCNLRIDRNSDLAGVCGPASIRVGCTAVWCIDKTMVSTPGCISGENFFIFNYFVSSEQNNPEINFRFRFTNLSIIDIF